MFRWRRKETSRHESAPVHVVPRSARARASLPDFATFRKTIRLVCWEIGQGQHLLRSAWRFCIQKTRSPRDPKTGGGECRCRTFQLATTAAKNPILASGFAAHQTKPDCLRATAGFAAWEPRIWAYMLTVRSLSCFRFRPAPVITGSSFFD